MSHPQTTFSILVCAYDEEKNIAHLLASVMAQRLPKTLILEQIFVIADGCLDQTASVVRQSAQKDGRIKLIEYKNRLGKPLAFNHAKNMIGSGFLVSLDADIVLAHAGVLGELLDGLPTSGIGLISGRIEPSPFKVPACPLVRRAFVGRFMVRSSLQHDIAPAFDNVYSVEGKILALHKRLYQNLVLPDTPGTDVEMFVACKKMQLKFRYCPDALVYFYPPATWRDFFYQHIRTRYALYYSQKRNDSHPQLDYGIRFKIIAILLRCLARAPFSTLVWIISVIIGDLLFLFQRKVLRRGMTGAWPYVSSTK